MEYGLPRHLSALARNDRLLSHIKNNLSKVPEKDTELHPMVNDDRPALRPAACRLLSIELWAGLKMPVLSVWMSG